jgi:DNA-binding transcriptional LysR family regulator
MLGTPKSKLSRHVADLEQAIGTQLLLRNSRRLELTEAGAEFYNYATGVMEQARAAQLAMQNRTGAAAGTLRVSASVAVAELLLKMTLPSFLTTYPKVAVALQATNQNVDLIAERVDIAIRGMKADPPSSDLIQSAVCTIRWGLLANRAYLANHPIRELGDLAEADSLMYRGLETSVPSWTLYTDDGDEVHQPTKIRMQTENLTVLKQVALSGMGVCELPLYVCRDELASGALQQVLPLYRPRFGRLALMYPSRRGMTLAARSFAEHFQSSIHQVLRPGEVVDLRK